MIYRADKHVIDTHTQTQGHTDRHTDAGDDNTRGAKLASGKTIFVDPIKQQKTLHHLLSREMGRLFRNIVKNHTAWCRECAVYKASW